ncbi:MAG: hypothetical protein HS105_11935 [Chloracidobacterium sp.]|nr:hypothetical protein [Chloracidobacterium sp.]MCO5332975.1 hypothetical protein [Pyrinomonadaceae bacterium]
MRLVFVPVSEPTVVITTGPAKIREHTDSSPSALYLLIGVLGTALVATLIYVFILSDTKPDSQKVTSDSTHPSILAKQSHATIANNSERLTRQSVSSNNNTSYDAEIKERLEKWKSDGEARNADALMENYAFSVDYYKKRGATRDFIKQDRSRAYSKYTSIKIDLTNININYSDDASALVTLDKGFILDGNGHLDGKVQQQIKMIRINGVWLIKGERDTKVYYMNH